MNGRFYKGGIFSYNHTHSTTINSFKAVPVKCALQTNWLVSQLTGFYTTRTLVLETKVKRTNKHFSQIILEYPAGIYNRNVNNRNTKTGCEICSKLITKTPERRQWLRSDVFIINFEHISPLVLLFLLLTLRR